MMRRDSFSSQEGEVDNFLLCPCIRQSPSKSVASAVLLENGRACPGDIVHNPGLYIAAIEVIYDKVMSQDLT